MRFSALAAVPIFAAAALLASCGREDEGLEADAPAQEEKAAPASGVSAPVSDELPGLPAPATGIAFWDHPTLSFNGLMIVASEEGLISYSMEDGTEVSRAGDIAATGAAAGYLGLGPRAAGFVATYDKGAKAFRFYGVDNGTRLFLPLDGGPAVEGDVNGFCMGRGEEASAPSLFALQKGKIAVFNLAPDAKGVAVESGAEIPVSKKLVACAVGRDGALLAAAADGAVYKLAGDAPFDKAFAKASVGEPGGLAVMTAQGEDGGENETLIFLAGLANGEVEVFDSNGAALGSVLLEGASEMPAVGAADVFGATSANLGAVYRNGVIAFGVVTEEGGPAIRIAPASTVKNALSLPVTDAVSPRGEAAVSNAAGVIMPATEFEPN